MPHPRTREQRLRRIAARQGKALWKCRTRDEHAIDYGLWLIVPAEQTGDPWAKTYVERSRQGLTLDEVEQVLTKRFDLAYHVGVIDRMRAFGGGR